MHHVLLGLSGTCFCCSFIKQQSQHQNLQKKGLLTFCSHGCECWSFSDLRHEGATGYGLRNNLCISVYLEDSAPPSLDWDTYNYSRALMLLTSWHTQNLKTGMDRNLRGTHKDPWSLSTILIKYQQTPDTLACRVLVHQTSMLLIYRFFHRHPILGI